MAGVVGSDLDPSVGIVHPEYNLRTYTLWGELGGQWARRSADSDSANYVWQVPVQSHGSYMSFQQNFCMSCFKNRVMNLARKSFLPL
ncbi:MAG: hypothetical protein H6657_24875 [Ardenticatenaceae bacterium]|nr:hypothetical protein [Ardenticatenaceae bacterium]